MRAWPLHVAFAIIFAGSLAAQDRTTDVLAESGTLGPAAVRVARSHGLTFRAYTRIADTDVLGLVFEAPGCSRPVLVVLLPVTFDQERVVRSAREPRYVLRYVYIGRTWDKADRLAVFAERTKYAAFAVFGLTRYLPSWHLLLVESPRRCQLSSNIDWQMAWSRDYLTAADSDTAATAR